MKPSLLTSISMCIYEILFAQYLCRMLMLNVQPPRITQLMAKAITQWTPTFQPSRTLILSCPITETTDRTKIKANMRFSVRPAMVFIRYNSQRSFSQQSQKLNDLHSPPWRHRKAEQSDHPNERCSHKQKKLKDHYIQFCFYPQRLNYI